MDTFFVDSNYYAINLLC